MFDKQTLRDINVKNQIVLVRTDYNVPLKDGKVTSDLRIRASLPTLEYLLEKGAEKIILISHLGRPDGQKVAELSLEPVADTLQKLLPNAKLSFINDVSGPEVETAVDNLPKGGILLLENLRFYPGEEQNSEDFAQEIVDSVHADLFVQDGFAVVHRAHASTSAITNCLPSVAGLLLEKEMTTLTKVMTKPRHPLLVVIGGAKVEDKQPMIDQFLSTADQIAVGGKIAADGYVAKSPKIYVAEDFDTDATGAKLDIGPLSSNQLIEFVKNSATIIWNGLLGKAEDPAYATSSTILAKTLGESTGKTTVICGGDTAGFVEDLALSDPKLSYSLISTGGGAALELLSGQALPGVEALEDR